MDNKQKMKTAKRKAQELIDKYLPHTQWWDYYWDVEIKKETRIKKAKEMAIICVNEILKAIDWHAFEVPNDDINYWEEVLTELNSL